MGQAQEDMATPIFDLIHKCLDSFNRIAAKHDETVLTRRPRLLDMRNRFQHWIDDTRALSTTDSSLDARLQGSAAIFTMVIELLTELLRNLHSFECEPADPSVLAEPTATDPKLRHTFLSKWSSASRAVETVLDQLHSLAVAIKKTCPEWLEHAVTTFLTEEDITFRKDMVSLVRYKFPAARRGLCEQLGDSIAVQRQMLQQVQHKRHAKEFAVGRAPKDAPTGNHESSISTRQEDPFDYPPAPKAGEGETEIRCPMCSMPLEYRQLEKEREEQWKRHVDEHIKPYACLFPKCARSLVLFGCRREWQDHMKSVHSEDWLRKVHALVWYCDVDHDPPITFDTELQWREHMQDLGSHPKRKLKAPAQNQLDALAPRRYKVFLRDKFVCPLCEQVPEQIRHFVEGREGDPTDMYNFVVDHVANHLKALFLMAVPSFENATQETPDLSGESVFMMTDSFSQLVNEDSVPHPLSGGQPSDGISFPPEGAFANWDSHVPSAEFDIDSKDDSGRTELSRAVEAGDVVTAQVLLDNGANLEITDQDGQTPLIRAAYNGNRPIVLVLIDYGANVEATDQIHGRTSVSWAAGNGCKDVLRTLLNHGASVKKVDPKFKQTPLLFAAQNGHEETVWMLLHLAAADLEPTDIHGRTALWWAIENGHDSVAQLLRSTI